MAYDDSRLPAGAAHHILLEGREPVSYTHLTLPTNRFV